MVLAYLTNGFLERAMEEITLAMSRQDCCKLWYVLGQGLSLVLPPWRFSYFRPSTSLTLSRALAWPSPWPGGVDHGALVSYPDPTLSRKGSGGEMGYSIY